jgi:TonB family protein
MNRGNSGVLILVLLVSATCAAGAEPARRFDPVITRGEVVSIAAFERALERAASASAVGPELAGTLLAGFKSYFRGRVVSNAEWRLFVLDFLYRSGVAHLDAHTFLTFTDLGDGTGVDAGFLDQVREVAVSPAPLRGGRAGVTAPRALRNPSPVYPASVQGARIEGVVALTCVVLEDGSVANCRLKRALGHGIDEAALLTVQNEWRFEPARRDGKPVAVEANVEISMAVF